jgi:uncharacterized protein (TIGR02996 family)
MVTDPADFLSNILAHPNDDGPRLAYADWLEERGDPRGEFIRVQCQIARADPDCRGAWRLHEVRQRVANRGLKVSDYFTIETIVLSCERCWPSLRRRERELLDCYAGQWWTLFGDEPCNKEGGSVQWVVDPSDRTCVTVFRRGFVAEVTCRLEDWFRPCGRCNGTGERYGLNCTMCNNGNFGHGPAIVRSTPLEVVRIIDCKSMESLDPPGWYWEDEPAHVRDTPGRHLPTAVFDVLKNYYRESTRPIEHYTRWKLYHTEADANAALSDALIRRARSVNARTTNAASRS